MQGVTSCLLPGPCRPFCGEVLLPHGGNEEKGTGQGFLATGVLSDDTAVYGLVFILESEAYPGLATEASAHSRTQVCLWPSRLGNAGSAQCFLLSLKGRD